MLEDGIMEITEEVAHQIIKSGEGGGKYRPYGLFWRRAGHMYIGLDNSHGNCWVEEFKTKRACIKWLRGD